MIVSLHVATGAAGGAATGSRVGALLVGPLVHMAGDRIPHHDIDSQRFEMWSGVAAVLALMARRGVLDPATIGALAGALPDLEHVVKLPRPGGRKLFPTHRVEGWHGRGGLPTWLQLLLAGAILGWLLRPGRNY